MAKLTSKWWDEQKPAGFKCDFGSKLKDFESTVRRGNEAAIFDALGALTPALQDAEALLKRRLKADPVKSKLMMAEIKTLHSLITKESSSLVKHGAKEIPVWSRDFGKAVTAKVHSAYPGLTDFKVNGGMVALKLSLMTVRALENSGTEARMIRAANDIFDARVDKLFDSISAEIDQLKGARPAKSKFRRFSMIASKAIGDMEKELVVEARKTVQRAASYHKQAKEFKFDRAIAVTTASLGVAGSAAGIAMPGTTALAIVGLIRSCAKLIEEVVNLMMTLEAKYKSVMAQLKLLQKSYAKGAQDGKEIAKTTVNALVGADVMVTHKACMNRVDDFKGTLAVLADRVNKSQQKIFDAIAKLADLNGALRRAVHDQKKFKSSVTGKKIKGLEAHLGRMLDRASDTMARVVDAEKKLPKLEAAVIKLGDNTTTAKVAEKAIPAVVNLGFALGSFGDGLAASRAAANVTAISLGLASDVASELVEVAT